MNNIKIMENSLFSPAHFEHYYKMAEMLSKSTITPVAYRNKPADVFIALEMGFQLGLPVIQSIQDIAVINGKPCIYGDGLMALVLSNSECEDIKESAVYDDNGKVIAFSCTAKRKGHDPYTVEFTIDHAKKSNLWGKSGPWTTYPERMLQMRARSWALRDKFADALRGIKTVEEVEDYEMIEKKPNEYVEKDKIPKLSHTEQLKSILPAIEEPAFASEEQLERLTFLISEAELSSERILKALHKYEAPSLDRLIARHAHEFILYLERELEKK